jgi:hypothetical protein
MRKMWCERRRHSLDNPFKSSPGLLLGVVAVLAQGPTHSSCSMPITIALETKVDFPAEQYQSSASNSGTYLRQTYQVLPVPGAFSSPRLPPLDK